jgi:hypothetical protein
MLDLQNFSKENNEEIIDVQEDDGEVISPMKGERNDKTEKTPVQKNEIFGKIVKS